VDATIQSNVSEWNAAFGEYVKFTSKTPQEALEHKVKALGIALWKGFTAHQFGGSPRQKGIAKSELAARTAAGQGTKVRGYLMAEYEAGRDALRSQAKALKQALHQSRRGTLDQWSSATAAIEQNRNERVNLWASIVGREVGLRGSGIGALGAAFLWYRRRGKGENSRIVTNRRGQKIGSVEVSDGVALITGMVDGLNTVDARYGIVTQAIKDETDDTMKYVKEKQDAEAARLLRSAIG
jgi:hypothetical protein